MRRTVFDVLLGFRHARQTPEERELFVHKPNPALAGTPS
jgi:hypothetical protein